MNKCLLGLGSNLGDPAQTLSDAFERLDTEAAVRLVAASSLHQTKPVGGPEGQGLFANAAAVVQTDLSPHELIEVLQRIEREAGRERRDRWAARTLDIDLLLYGQQVLADQRLHVPHPRMSFRPFVLAPAVEVAETMIHPLLQQTLGQLWRQLRHGEDRLEVVGGECNQRQIVAGVAKQLRPGVRVDTSIADPTGARLTVALSTPGPLSGAGPTLWLVEDLPRDQQREELAAALDCVWPGLG